MKRFQTSLVVVAVLALTTVATVKLTHTTPAHPTVTRSTLANAAWASAPGARVALVVGNSNYSSGALPNPGNDAKLISDTLSQLGFDVVLRRDADQKTMKRAIEEFGTRLSKAGANAVGLFFYAGHGVQLNGHNYLIPTTADIEHEGDLDIEGVSADWVLEQMREAGNDVNIVVLDACRNNPFKRSMRSLDRGLAVMDAPKGTVIAYSTAPGEVAADGDGRDSPYSAALASAMRDNREPVEQMFKHVRVAVLDATRGQQTPWEASSLTGDFAFADRGKSVRPLAGTDNGVQRLADADKSLQPVSKGLQSPPPTAPASPSQGPTEVSGSFASVAPGPAAPPAQAASQSSSGSAAFGQLVNLASALAPALIARSASPSSANTISSNPGSQSWTSRGLPHLTPAAPSRVGRELHSVQFPVTTLNASKKPILTAR